MTQKLRRQTETDVEDILTNEMFCFLENDFWVRLRNESGMLDDTRISPARCQFHQHFKSSFCANIFAHKHYKPSAKLSVKKTRVKCW